MAAIPQSALEDHSAVFWHRFWQHTGRGIPQNVEAELCVFEPKSCRAKDYFLWLGGTTRDGYGRCVTGVGGEMRAHYVAWSFFHLDPVPEGCDIVHASLCKGGKLCMWPPCLLIVQARGPRSKGKAVSAALLKAYNAEIE